MVISVAGLAKSYQSVRALDDITFDVHKGEIFGILGPNGAGKTTLIETLIGLRKPDAGQVSVLGQTPWGAPASWRERIGVQLQATALYPRIRAEEALRLFASFYTRGVDPVQLLDRLGLSHRRKAMVRTLSGGEQQRLSLAIALVHDPELIFLDEFSTGLDPIGRRSVWEFIQELRDQGKTVVLTTHLMDEAEALCDRVLFIARGRAVAIGETRELIASKRVANLDELYLHYMRREAR